jgi:hypothetical protein
MFRDQRLELSDELPCSPERKLGLDSRLERTNP